MFHLPQMKLARSAATCATLAALATVGAVALSARSAPAMVRLVAVSAQGNAVLIEASEPVAYAVKQPDPLTVVVELRGVSVADAANDVARRDPVAGVTLEQGSPVDGRPVARVRVALARPAEYAVRSARSTIRLELTPGARPAAPLPAPLRMPEAPPEATATVATTGTSVPAPAMAEATVLERVRTARGSGITTVTLSGNGRLTPANVGESVQPPRRLLLDFANVSSRAPEHTSVNDPLVKRVQVVNEKSSASTRVAIELAPTSTYHVARVGAEGEDLAIVFASSQASKTVMLTPETETVAADVEPDISMAQAIANASALTLTDVPPDPVAAIKALASSPRANVARSAPVVAPPAAAPATAAAPAPRLRSVSAAAAVQQQQQPPAPSSGGLQQADKRYSGHPITLDIVGADLRSVLRQFHEISGLNIIMDPGVPSTPVDIQLNDIPWDQAFETLLRTHQLGYEADGTIIRIAPLKVLEDEQKQRQTLAAAKALAGTLQVQTFPLSYAKAQDMQALIVKSALSDRGLIQVDPRTNVLIITDLPDRLQTAANLIGALDRAEPQVEVEARVVQTTREFAKAIGVQWGLNGRVSPAIGNTTPLAFPNSGSLGGRTGQVSTPTDPSRATGTENTATVVNLPVPGASGAIGLALGAVNGAFNLDVALSALERSGKGRVLSTPRLTTQNNVQAEVAQGVQVPIQTVANNTVTVTFRDATLKLVVTPQITSANTVIMKIELQNETPDFSRQVNGIPPIDTQRANTQVQVNDGATTVIGGIFVSREQVSNERLPVLHRVPLLGWLFKRDSTSDESRELLIFITPRILRG